MTNEQREAIEITSKYLNFNEICGTRNFKEALATVLSMLKEKDKLYNKALSDLVKADRENIQLKKQINLMANFINDNTPYTKDTKELENEEGIRTVDFTIKYFERKIEE